MYNKIEKEIIRLRKLNVFPSIIAKKLNLDIIDIKKVLIKYNLPFRNSKYKINIGEKYNRLTVLKVLPINNYKEITYLCECVCGKEVNVKPWSLASKNTQSCGCLVSEISSIIGKNNVLKNGNSSENRVYNSYRKAAKNRNYTFELTKEECKKYFSSNCYYCNDAPKRTTKLSSTLSPSFTFNGIDRLDNLKGYTLNNCVSCCTECNKAKGVMSANQFKEWVKKVYQNFIYGK